MNALLLIVSVACAGMGYAIGKPKNRATEGLVLGLLLGVIGLLIVALLKPKPVSGSGYGPPPGAYGPPPTTFGQPQYGQPSAGQPNAGTLAPAPPQDETPGQPVERDQPMLDKRPEPPVGDATGWPPPGRAQWLPDPTGRHDARWWDGMQWSTYVSDQGVTSTDTTMDSTLPPSTS